jgi:uncharacterized protein involved in exopolysaccharide biosynthesis
MNLSSAKRAALRTFIYSLLKHKGKALAVFGIIVGGIAVTSFIVKPTYEAVTKIAITVEYGAGGSAPPATGVTPEKLIRAELDLLAGKAIIGEVINEIGLRQLYPHIYVKYLDNRDLSTPDTAVVSFQKSMKTKASVRSDTIIVSFQHENPSMAAQVVNKLVERLKQRHMPTGTQPEITAPTIAEVKKPAEIPKKQGKKEEKRTNNESRESLNKQKDDLTGKISAIETELSSTNAAISKGEDRAQQLKSPLSVAEKRAGSGEKAAAGTLPVSDLRQRLAELRLQEQTLLKTYKETSGAVSLVRQEIQQAEQALAHEERIQKWNALVKIEQELKTLRARASSLKTDLNQNQTNLVKIERALEEATSTASQREAERAQEEAASKKMAQAPTIKVIVVEAAAPPLKPVWPIIPLNILIAIILGLPAAIGIAFLAERRTHTFDKPEDIEERLGLRVLACVDQPAAVGRKKQ